MTRSSEGADVVTMLRKVSVEVDPEQQLGELGTIL
jgi:hypothetical protein